MNKLLSIKLKLSKLLSLTYGFEVGYSRNLAFIIFQFRYSLLNY